MNRATIGAIMTLACLAAGCDSDEEAEPDTIRNAAQATARRGAARVTMSVELRGGDQSATMTTAGYDDPARRRASYEVRMGEFAELDPRLGPPSDWEGRVVKIGPKLYLSLPFVNKIIREQAGDRATWLAVDVSRRESARGPLARALSQTTSTTPGQLIEYALASEAERELGQERVGGVETTHYAGRVQLEEVDDHVPPSERAAIAANAEEVQRRLGEDTIPIDAWVDRAGLLRRLRLRYEFGGASDPFAVAEADLSRHGARVAFERPTRGVVTIAELAPP